MAIDKPCACNQLEIEEAEKVYCPDGSFDPEEMIQTLTDFHAKSVKVSSSKTGDHLL